MGALMRDDKTTSANDPMQPTAPPTAGEAAQVASKRSGKSRTLWSDATRRLRRNRLAMIGLAWIFIIVVIALSADLWAPQWLGSPSEFDSTTMGELKHLPPSAEHPFGTDKRGLDVASRIVYGSRYSLAVGIIATSIALSIGLVMGTLAAYYGGFIDSLVMRLADVFLAFPYILFAIALIAVLGRGFVNLFIAIGVLAWPTIARVVRSSILSVKENEYVDAARALGASDIRIMLRHMLPNAMAPIIVYGTMSIGGAILSEAALSFLGLGVQFPDPSWGHMLSEARGEMISYPWLMIFPGAAILTTVLAFVLLGDGLRDALDVKMKD
ncbi:MAG: ABC transporter permease [Coriobacteriia bacterium]|nr:ABC transporter permease [Coriobacteriia bacterium]